MNVKLIRIIVGAVLLAAATIIGHSVQLPVWQMLLIYLVPYLVVGYDVVGEAFEGICHGEVFDEDFLMFVATVGAMCIGFLPGAEPQFAEAVFVMLFFQEGELFEHYAEHRSRRSIRALMDIRPDTANVLRDGKIQTVSPDTIAVGETIIVKPGERVALDGEIVDGTSALNTVALTGESMPRDVRKGDQVVSGCVNISGVLTVKVQKSFGESTASKIINMVENASEKKSTLRPCLYAYSCHSGTGSGVCSAIVLRWLCRSTHHVALPCVDIPRGFMSLRFSHLHSAVVLRRYRWSVAPRHIDKGCKLYRRSVRTRYRCVRQDRNPHSRRILR